MSVGAVRSTRSGKLRCRASVSASAFAVPSRASIVCCSAIAVSTAGGSVGSSTIGGGSAVATTSVAGSPVTSRSSASIQPCSSEFGGKMTRNQLRVGRAAVDLDVGVARKRAQDGDPRAGRRSGRVVTCFVRADDARRDGRLAAPGPAVPVRLPARRRPWRLAAPLPPRTLSTTTSTPAVKPEQRDDGQAGEEEGVLEDGGPGLGLR